MSEIRRPARRVPSPATAQSLTPTGAHSWERSIPGIICPRESHLPASEILAHLAGDRNPAAVRTAATFPALSTGPLAGLVHPPVPHAVQAHCETQHRARAARGRRTGAAEDPARTFRG